MRAIFILLFAANLVFFGYQYFVITKNEAELSLRPKPAVVADGEGLRLLAEQAGPSVLPTRAAPQAKLESVNADDKRTSNDFCTMIGPYSQLLQAEYAMERLVALGAEARVVPIEVREGESFWVYLPPQSSEKEALRRLYELQKKNIESHVITKGELTNAISFGRYADYVEAEARSAEIQKQGYQVAIKMFPKMIQETWVVIDGAIAEKIDDTVWADLLSKESMLEKRQNFCLGVASQ